MPKKSVVEICLEYVAQRLPYSSNVFHKCVKKDELGANNISKDFLPNTSTTNTTIKRGSNCHSRKCTTIWMDKLPQNMQNGMIEGTLQSYFPYL